MRSAKEAGHGNSCLFRQRKHSVPKREEPRSRAPLALQDTATVRQWAAKAGPVAKGEKTVTRSRTLLPKLDTLGAPLGFEDFPTAEPPRRAARYSIGIDSLSDEAWDAAVSGFADLSLEQSAAYNTARWGKERGGGHVLITEGETVIGGARVVELKVPGLKKGLAYVKYGPIWRRRDSPAAPEHFDVVITALVDEYCNRRGLLLSVLSRPNPDFTALETARLKTHGFEIRRTQEDRERYFVNLTIDDDAQRNSVSRNWRQNLKKAENSGLTFAIPDKEPAFRQFVGLHRSMVERKNAAKGDAVGLVPYLQSHLPEMARPRIVIAYKDGQPVTGAVIATLGDTAYYIYGATNAEALPIRAGYGLHWWIVNWLSGQGLKWYDLGGTVGNAGLRQFKKGFAGTAGRIVEMPPEFDYWHRDGDRLAGDVLFAARGFSKGLAGVRGLVPGR